MKNKTQQKKTEQVIQHSVQTTTAEEIRDYLKQQKN